VKANGIAGVFTLRCNATTPPSPAPVDFLLSNVAIAPASIVPADPLPSYTYSGAVKLRALVRDAAGNPVAGAAVTFTSPSFGVQVTEANGWVHDGTTNTRVVLTGADGIADASNGFSLLNAYQQVTVVASVPVWPRVRGSMSTATTCPRA
jgi:hypothetical protein